MEDAKKEKEIWELDQDELKLEYLTKDDLENESSEDLEDDYKDL